jgi:3-oxoadipate enol-lactonase
VKRYLSVIPLVLLVCFVVGCHKGEEIAEEGSEFQIETGYADVNNTRLYYEIAGSGDTLVLIHGNFGDNRHWDGQFEALAKNHKVIRYDVRGYGRSSLPVEGESYSNHDDLKALLEHLGISNAHVCGLSMGSGIAVDFALAYPKMCESLIPIGPWAFGYNSPATAEINELFGKISSVLKESGTKAAADCWSDSYGPPILMPML